MGLEDGFSGGCQCGACRFTVMPGPVNQTVCHCAMCRRAVSNAFAPLADVAEDRVTWDGTPKTYASSNIAERGFCATCGSPLFYRRPGTGMIEIMAGALDAPDLYAPIRNHGAESRLDWLATLATIPSRDTFFSNGETVTSHQHEATG